jgi:hypothetical protein
VVNLSIMTASPYRADPATEPLDLTDPAPPVIDRATERYEPVEEPTPQPLTAWAEPSPEVEDRGAGGRMVLGWALSLLAAAWIAFAAWSLGTAASSSIPSAAEISQGIAILAGPLGLLGLVWLMFGRTRRREGERFTRTVIAMRSETRSLEAVLAVLRERIADEHSALTSMADRLMSLGDEASVRLGTVRRDLESGADALSRQGIALDQAAQSARVDLGILLEDLPRAEASARLINEQLRTGGQEATGHAATLETQLAAIGERTREADEQIGAAAQRLVAHLSQIDGASGSAAERIAATAQDATSRLDALLVHAAEALQHVRTGIDAEAQAVTALVTQSAAGIGKAGIEASEALATRLSAAGGGLDRLGARIAEHDAASQRLVAGLDRGLADLDQRFVDLAAEGDSRAAAVAASIGRVRGSLDELSVQSAASDASLAGLAARTAALNQHVAELQTDIGARLSDSLSGAEGTTERLAAAVAAARPGVEELHSLAFSAADRLSAGAHEIGEQQGLVRGLLASITDGVGGAEEHLARLNSVIANANLGASRLQAETGPALVAALMQVRDASAHAANRAREAIHAVIPQSAQMMATETRKALEAAVRDGVAEQLREVETVATRAVEAAQSASERLTRQMLSIGQSAAALEAHIEKSQHDSRAADSEAFAKRSAMLIDSMHSAAIDVGKILSDEVDDRAWAAYLKGDRGVFTRRAVRLLGNSETRGLGAHYDTDGEFHASVDRYVHDFEAMLRRVLNERDGGMMGVTLLSSDMGKLYAALAQLVDRKR